MEPMKGTMHMYRSWNAGEYTDVKREYGGAQSELGGVAGDLCLFDIVELQMLSISISD